MGDLIHEGTRRPLTVGRSLFDEADDLALAVPASCRRSGRCHECIVQVLRGADALSAPTEQEGHLGGSFRLACQAFVTRTDSDVEFALLRRHVRILSDADAGPDADAAGGCDGSPSSPDAFAPAAVRDGDVVRYLGEAIDTYRGALLGLAIDIGTTTVVVEIVDLEHGRTIRIIGVENPQRFGGSDVITRIAYEAGHPGELRRALRRVVNRELAAFYRETGIDRRAVVEAMVVGNPTMRDLFFGLDVAPLGHLPFRSVTEHAVRAGTATDTGVVRRAFEVGLLMHPRGRVVGAPIIASHVGADTAADLVSTELLAQPGVTMLIDIGTNTEIVVTDGQRVLAASSPAGPAFEGGGISRGMVAGDGAVDAVGWSGTGFSYRTIGDAPAEGICGSGLVDFLAAARAGGLMDPAGAFAAGATRLDLVPDRAIGMTRADVAQLVQAKAATAAGQQILMRRLGVGLDDIETLVLAGGFADSLDIDHAAAIGLLVPVARHRVVRAGNAAARGARDLLLSVPRRASLAALVGRVEHVELEAEPDFFDLFVDGLSLEPMRLAGPALRATI